MHLTSWPDVVGPGERCPRGEAEPSWNKRQRGHCSDQMSKSASFVRLFVGLILTATGVHASCPIELSPPSVVVKYGDPVSVNCSTSEILFEGIGWEATQGGRSLEPVNHLTWAVENLTDWTISPSCFINGSPNGTFDQCSKTAKVVLYTFPENISISSSTGSDGVMIEKEIYDFRCHIHRIAPVQHLNVRWYKGNNLISTNIFNTTSKKPLDRVSVYRFTPTKQDNGVTFRCEAHLDLGPEGSQFHAVSQDFNITVNYPPSEITGLEDSEVEVGSAVWLKCSSTGFPQPKYSWDYYLADNVTEENEDGMSLLLIHNANAHNTGSYTCHASNERGNVSKTAKVTVKGAKQKCPIEITPERMVIPYQGTSRNATCKTTSTSTRNVKEIYWQDLQGIKTYSESWHVDTHKDWDPRPVCTATFVGIGACHKTLNFTLYKTPDSVFIHPVHNLSSAVEGGVLQLQCDIVNVAPARNLVVWWYQGNDTNQPLGKGSMRVIGCLPENSTNCDINVIRSPVNVSSTVSINLNRGHNGADFRCEAQMDLGPEGPQHPLNMMSIPFNIPVHYKPIINATKLPKRIPVFRGYPEELVCEADGHPPPKINWLYSSDKVPRESEDTLIVFEAGFYNCTATNEVGSVFHVVEVILKEDYLPLIAGFVAVTVVAISVVFLFIYSIYYKNTKMRRYSLKNPKLSTHNGNVAHNGWDLQFPMTKLSYILQLSCECALRMGGPKTAAVLTHTNRKCTAITVVNSEAAPAEVSPTPARPPPPPTHSLQIIDAPFTSGRCTPARRRRFTRGTLTHHRTSTLGIVREGSHQVKTKLRGEQEGPGFECTFGRAERSYLLFSRGSFAGWYAEEIMLWLFLFSGVIASAGKPASASCQVELSPPSVVVRYGDSLSVLCSSSSNQTEGMGWESPLGGIAFTTGVSFLTLKIDSVKHWSIAPQCYINLLDGSQCFKPLPVTVYKTPDSVSLSELGQMVPLVEGRLYRMECDIANVAPASGFHVHWYKGNEMIKRDTFDESKLSPVNKTSVLNLTAKRDDNGTQIWCGAKLHTLLTGTNLTLMRSKSREVIVLYPPTFNKPENETVEAPDGSKIILNCTSTGNPLPVYSWHFPESIQQMNENHNANQPILTRSFQSPGTYSCTASNTQGTSTKYFTVIEAPRNRTTFAAIVGGFVFLGILIIAAGVLFVTPEGTFSLNKGSYLRGRPTSAGPVSGPFCSNIIPCRVAKLLQVGIFFRSPLNRRLSAGNNMGNDFLRWILTFCTFYSVSGEGCSLTLKPSRVVVGFGEPVSVSCEAARPVRVLGWESAISAAHTQQDLSVQWKVDSLIDWIEEPICYGVFFTAPRQCEEKLNLVLYKTPDSVSIRPVNHTGPMVEGKEYQLLCEVQNVAPVQYLTLRWYRGQTEVYNHSFSDLTSSSPVQVSSILLITPTKAENGAQYKCVAELELGPEGPQPAPTVTSEPLNASVYFPPMFLSPEPEVLDLRAGGEISLNCTATGNPKPMYSWQSSHPMQETFEDEAVLTSSSLLPGTYTCIASNTLEKKSKQFIVRGKTKGV
ncbi:hemicentin-1-like [Xiphias gladius]|uniref:hemicentin-1-like n=1 Tax=Xiphias gladius TaxID=8245 RepID=UPI001A98636C|nr:hemicentin-1-like [Xiphias gladius]